MSSETVGSRFERALELIYGKKNNKEISIKYNMTQQAIGQLKGKDSINKTISFICATENINLNWIQTGNGDIFLKETSSSQNIEGNNNISINGTSNKISNINSKEEQNDTSQSSLVEIPYFSDTYASAGAGALNYDDKPKPMAFDSGFLRSLLGITTFKNLHIINAIGNSMEPTITEGELLFINPFENEFNQIKDGGIYVINCNNSVFVKRINHNPITGSVVLLSDNDKVPEIQISGQEFENCVIIGRVVGHFASL